MAKKGNKKQTAKQPVDEVVGMYRVCLECTQPPENCDITTPKKRDMCNYAKTYGKFNGRNKDKFYIPVAPVMYQSTAGIALDPDTFDGSR